MAKVSALVARAGIVKAANTVVLSFFAGKLGLFRPDERRDFLWVTFTKPTLQVVNLKALVVGWKVAGEGLENQSA